MYIFEYLKSKIKKNQRNQTTCIHISKWNCTSTPFSCYLDQWDLLPVTSGYILTVKKISGEYLVAGIKSMCLGRDFKYIQSNFAGHETDIQIMLFSPQYRCDKPSRH